MASKKKAKWHRKIGVWIFRLSWRLLWASQKPFAKRADQLRAWTTDRVNWMQRAIASRIFSGSASDPQDSMHWTTILGEVSWMPWPGESYKVSTALLINEAQGSWTNFWLLLWGFCIRTKTQQTQHTDSVTSAGAIKPWIIYLLKVIEFV